MRLYVGIKANKLERAPGIVVITYFVLAMLATIGFVFFLVLQTYTLFFEIIVAGAGLGVLILESCFMVMAFADFRSLEGS